MLLYIIIITINSGGTMSFELPQYIKPDFSKEMFIKAADIKTATVEKKGVAPQNYHATTIFPEYYKIEGKWILAQQSRMDCVVVVKDNRTLAVTEPRRLETGDAVVLGRTEDCTDGIFVHSDGFSKSSTLDEVFSFRTGRSRETSYSRDYDKLYDLLKYEKEHGYVVWVLGPAVVFDSDSRKAMSSLVEHGFVDAVFAGNALATHDMEGSLYKTALGQDIYTQASYPNGHYHHLDVINKVRNAGSIKEIVDTGIINDGVIYSCVKNNVPFVLAGSIRDDGPLPEVIANVYDAQNEMRLHTKKATTVISLATQLHSIASGNMTPSYQVVDGIVRPVYIYSIDVSEFAVNKLRDRGTLAVTSIVTNVQDFLVNLERNLIK
jgi:lysine-ketoglutarate reductase/saccharopine dehydrogenase-like protein (TIGR00300 family)